ncbi:Gfo/Idh/MocA family oxidoreductase [Lentzea sp. NBRC 102530]|uniref:Gfo/Idh/MocA family oxidoreductase n=1 Tax=Lentzea sp. NBRC 102530 TaxID=3032201 RepID=UPI0025572CC3|nr:Gfo/Idh/MocA family oxidoreductase [Lentzea sp. NBRC 102530]
MNSTARLAIVGLDSSRPARLREFLAGPVALVTPQDAGNLIGQVDAVLLCTRDGRDHAAQALPLLRAGISVWVDKPLATREADARAMVGAAAATRVVLACRSGFRDAAATREAEAWVRDQAGPVTVTIEGPADPRSPYGGLAHYGVHHVELACELAARPLDVHSATDRRARLTGENLTVDLVFRPEAEAFTITAGERLRIEAPATYLEDQVAAFLDAVERGLGTADPEALVEPVRLLERILG